MDPKTLDAIFAPAFLVMGLSHLLQPKLWVRFFATVRQTGLAAIIIPLYTLPVALVLIVGHNVWAWNWSLLLTIAGWGMMIKCVIYLLVPGVTDRLLAQKMPQSERTFQIAGALMAFFGGMLTWQAWS